MQYFKYTITDPSQARHNVPFAVFRMDLSASPMVLDKWVESNNTWIFWPDLFRVTGVGGDDGGYQECGEEEVKQFMDSKGLAKAWDEGKHPRGQPDNAGEFANRVNRDYPDNFTPRERYKTPKPEPKKDKREKVYSQAQFNVPLYDKFGSGSELTNYLNLVTSVGGGRKGFRYNSEEAIVKGNGQTFKPQELPKKYKRGKLHECYMNAYNLASRNSDLTYCEGFATISAENAIPISHAWCVDREGNVVDNTWPTPGGEYIGVPLKTDFVQKVIWENGVYGVLGYPNKFLKDGLPLEAIADYHIENKPSNYAPLSTDPLNSPDAGDTVPSPLADIEVGNKYVPEEYKDVICSYSRMDFNKPFIAPVNRLAEGDSRTDEQYFAQTGKLVKDWVDEQKSIGADPMIGIGKIILTRSEAEFDSANGDFTLRMNLGVPDFDEQLKKDGIVPGDKKWQVIAQSIGEQDSRGVASFYSAQFKTLVCRPIINGKAVVPNPFSELERLIVSGGMGMKDSSTADARMVFDHECGHAVYYSSKTRKAWKDKYKADKTFDRHTDYAKSSDSEGFAESYVAYVASKRRTARYAPGSVQAIAEEHVAGRAQKDTEMIDLVEQVIKGQL